MNKPFVGLTREDCSYLLTLIEDMDSTTAYTARQRGYTIPKLQTIAKDPRSGRLAYQDVEYLIDLVEDDELPETEQQREMTLSTLQEILSLQTVRFQEQTEIERQREARRLRRSPVVGLQEHFPQTK